MKKLACSLLTLLLLFALIPQFTFAAESNIQLYLNGKKLNPEAAPRKINSISMVPVRIISENLGAKVTWNQAEMKATVQKDDTLMQFTIGKKEAIVNSKNVQLEEAPLLVAPGTTLLPVRIVAENLGFQVDWDDPSQTVKLMKNPETPKPPTDGGGSDKPSGSTNPNNYPELQSIGTAGTQITVQASGAVTPKMMALSNPDRLVIDLPKAAFSTALPAPAANQMGEVVSKITGVSKIRYAMNDPQTSTIRIVLDLAAKTGYKLVENGSTGKVVIELTGAVPFKVVIDAGHGDQDPGALSITGKKEKDFNLAMATKVVKLLENEPMIQPYMTRSDDTFVELDGRVKYANDLGADAFISIHGNKYTAGTRGTETYYYTPQSLQFANIMHSQVVKAAGFPDRKVRQNDFRVIKYTTMPSILIEVGYLSNVTDESWMYTEDFQNRVAAGIVAGIKQNFNIN